MLLEAGAVVDMGTGIDGDWTPLMEACRAGAEDSVALLLERGADAKRTCAMLGETVLEIAKKHHHPEIVAILEAATHPDG